MPAGTITRIRGVLVVLTLLVIALGVVKMRDDPRTPWEGFLTDWRSRVIAVMPGSPAEMAGMQVGDAIETIDGASITDTRAMEQLPRGRPGTPRFYGITRGAAQVQLRLLPVEMPPSELLANRVASGLGLVFVLLPLWAFFVAPGAATLVLSIFGLCWGKAFLGSPYLAEAGWRSAFASLNTAAILIGFAALLHFMLIFPTRRPFMERREAGALVYWPAIIVAVVVLGFTLVKPERSRELAAAFGYTFGLLAVGYLFATLATLLRRHNAASVEDRSRHGLNLMLAGVVLGVFPLLLSTLMGLFAPMTYLPGGAYYYLALGLIPITCSLAAVQSARG